MDGLADLDFLARTFEHDRRSIEGVSRSFTIMREHDGAPARRARDLTPTQRLPLV